MAVGDLTLTNHGTFAVSGAALKTAVDAINITAVQFVSGARLHIIPIEFGQVQVLEVEVT